MHVRKMRHLLPPLALLLASSPSLAKEKSRGEQVTSGGDRQAMERDARRACLNGDYAKGVALLSELFLDSKDPNYIFNQGRCLEQNLRFEEAIGRFREYLRDGSIGARDREAAEKHIVECESLQAKQNPAAAPAAPVATVPVPLPPPAPVAAPAPLAEPSPAIEVTPSPPSASAGSGLRLGGLVAAGVGAAALATGLVLNLKANSLADSIDPPDHTFDRGTESTRSKYETLSWIAYGAGAAGLVTGAVLYAIGWSRSGDSQVALSPTIAPGLAGATLRSSF
jgi:hypothetical protein